MELLSQIWDKTTDTLSAGTERISLGLVRLFGNSNERRINKIRPMVEAINELEEQLKPLDDEQLAAKSVEFRRRLAEGETLDDILVEAFAVCREGGRRFLKMRHYDVQLMGGIVLHEGDIAEMVTGEGKTLVATLPAYLNALEGKGVHVVTVNDYLAKRDAEWMSPLYNGLGLSVGAIQSQMGSQLRRDIYQRDITYGTNNEFGFDYLRDNMKSSVEQQAQRSRHYAIIDEVDSILIDEARTPLIISGPAFDDVKKYAEADKIARQLKAGEHFEVKEKERTCHLNEDGVREAERLAGIESFYTPGNMEWPHLIDNSLKAHYLYKLDRDYVVQGGQVVIVDEFTGRLMEGRQWSDGLHQAVEAKERVKIKEENQTLATITLQNYFKLYNKLSGMTGTAMTEANEFYRVYKLDVVAMPTNRELQRVNYSDRIYLTEKEKYQAILDEIREVHREGRPILVGTASIERSEELGSRLKRSGIPHAVLNAKYHEREAEIVAQAGRSGAVTIATNMAGRGTDIILGGNPEFLAWDDLKRLKDEDGRPLYPSRLDVLPQVWREAVTKYEPEMKAEGKRIVKLGGLHVIGTERHESRRIDNQLRGRTGRQGDPGSSRFFLSLEDDLMRKFIAGEWIKGLLGRLGMEEGEPIENAMVTRRIEGAQKKVEERNFEVRKNLLEYDEVMDEQRKRVYSFRQGILEGNSTKETLLEMIDDQIDRAGQVLLDEQYGPSSFAELTGKALGVEFEPRTFRGVTDFEQARDLARDEALRQIEDQIREAVDENLPADAESSEWNWQALTNWASRRFGLTNLKEKSLRSFDKGAGDPNSPGLDRSSLEAMLFKLGQEFVAKVDLEPAAVFLQEDWGRRSLAGWAYRKFGLVIDPTTWESLNTDEIIDQLKEQVRDLYVRKEAEFPARIGVTRFLREKSRSSPNAVLDRDGLADWADRRLQIEVDRSRLRNMLRPEMEAYLLEEARNHYKGAEVAEGLEERLEDVYPARQLTGGRGQVDALIGPDRDAIQELVDYAQAELDVAFDPDELATLDPEAFSNRVYQAFDTKFRPEMAETEKILLLQILDSAWMEHLRTMDYLKSSVGLRGYAQVDPKIEYKREGMRQFESMWQSVSDRVTDLIFRIEQSDPDFLSSLSARLDKAKTVHQEASSAIEVSGSDNVSQRQEAAIAASQGKGETKVEPVRNLGRKVGRNDPCPCGSGRKYKACCMRKGQMA